MGGPCIGSYSKLLVFSVCIAVAALSGEGVRISRKETEDNLKKVSAANNAFALDLHRRLVAGAAGGNVFFSPFSLSVAFAMLYYGARGSTAQELRSTLGYDSAELADVTLQATFKQFLTRVLKSNSSKGYTVRYANAILVDKSLDLNPAYKKGVRSIYKGRVKNVDFVRNAPKISEVINKWVRATTDGMIESAVEAIPPRTLVMILNVIYFKGMWKFPFDPKYTSPKSFYNDGQESQATKVDMMTMMADFPVASALNSTIMEFPYEGDAISMLILLPDERGGLPALESKLTVEHLVDICHSMRVPSDKYYIQLPRFKIEFSKSLVEDLKAMNMSSIFSPGADFSGMVEKSGLAISDVVHKAAIETNEEGSTAAAVTTMTLQRSGTVPVFRANHPFLFAIVNKKNNLILFLGRLNRL